MIVLDLIGFAGYLHNAGYKVLFCSVQCHGVGTILCIKVCVIIPIMRLFRLYSNDHLSCFIPQNSLENQDEPKFHITNNCVNDPFFLSVL